MSQDAEIDMKEVELNELEPEKQPMTAAGGLGGPGPAVGGEKNGLVKAKAAEEVGVGMVGPEDPAALASAAAASAAAKFTGLSKEELLKVAGRPGWVRTRWALLVLFWLGWLGMLAGAVVIIVRAPRCRDLPAQAWWHKGPLYRVWALQAFRGPKPQPRIGGGIHDLKSHLDYLSTLKVKGLVVGPIHKTTEDLLNETHLEQIEPKLGNKEDFLSFLEAAKKKSIKVVLDLTPNYESKNSWFGPEEVEELNGKMKRALHYWLEVGVDGIQFKNVDQLQNLDILEEWQNSTQLFTSDKLLLVGTGSSEKEAVLRVLDQTSGEPMTNLYLQSYPSGEALREAVSAYVQRVEKLNKLSCGWSVSLDAHLSGIVPSHLLRLYQLLLFTLPGTPLFSYGDEIGLRKLSSARPDDPPVMQWEDTSEELVGFNMTVMGQSGAPTSLLTLFRHLSDRRGKERSLLHGDFQVIPTDGGPQLFAYVRRWDQNERFLVVLNLGGTAVKTQLRDPFLPSAATLSLSTGLDRPEGTTTSLESLSVNPWEGLLFTFPYVG
ncbi:4F2 cell-surface antigen heavy chain [Tachyglossus aculeatus]|uniref:4F2 cell-surface antigen heavy chain n=1 Tax=Tachyglossus aculeatus TaxID=9261 RepID=UPI0018F4C523|nr:4F2 cell-surface antigen heavy chain [Tachyglossus aculeatus]XP_038620873.1 4F2 cell-surface antigen heavy chain [Tachyglossus aculeatus]